MRPTHGTVFALLAEGALAPHISFSLGREKETCRAAVQRKRERGAAFVTKAAPFSFVLHVLISGFGAVRTGFATCAADANERTNDWMYVDL